MNILRIVPRYAGGLKTHLDILDRELLESPDIGSIKIVSELPVEGTLARDPLDREHETVRYGDLSHYRIKTAGQVGKMFPLLKGNIASNRFDIVHIHNHGTLTANLAALLARRYRRPVVLTYHESRAFSDPGGKRQWLFGLIPKRLADRKFGVSEAATRLLGPDARSTGVPIDKDRFSVDVRNLAGGSEEATPGSFRLIYPSRFTPAKGQIDLIEVMRHLERSAPGRFSLTMAGEQRFQDYVRGVRKQVADYGLQGRVRIEDHYDFEAMNRFYALGDLQLFPTRYPEGLAKIVIEAGLCGIPTIAYRTRSMAELIESGVNGYIVPPGDALGMAKLVLKISGEGEHFRALKKNVRKAFSDRFAPAEVARCYLDCYRQLTRSGKSGG